MLNVIITLTVVVLGLLGYGVKSATDKKKLKEEVQTLKDTKEVLTSQMETINEVRKELNLIDEEAKPEKKSSAPSGDSASRIDRLNSLSDKTGNPTE